MPSHVETLLTTLGLPAEEVTKIISLPEEDITFDAQTYADQVKSNYQKQFQNDPAFFEGATLEKLPAEVVKKLESTQFARASAIMKSKVLKGFGMTEADVNDLTEDQKEKLDSYISAVAEKYTKSKSGAKEVQEQLIAERKKNEEYISKFGPDYEQTIKTKYEGEANQKITSAIFNAALIGELSAIPGLKIKASTLAREANEILSSKYAFEKVGDYAVELRQKANPQMKVLKENSSHELTLREALAEIAENEGWIEKEKDGGPGSGKIKIEPVNGHLKMTSPHVQDKISKKIAEESKI